jgi:hypothetical protein
MEISYISDLMPEDNRKRCTFRKEYKKWVAEGPRTFCHPIYKQRDSAYPVSQINPYNKKGGVGERKGGNKKPLTDI